MIARTTIAALLALGVTFGLFALMQALIGLGERPPHQIEGGRAIEFVRLHRESEVARKERELPERRTPRPPPPPPAIQLAPAPAPSAGELGGLSVDLGADLDVDLGGPALAAPVADREAVPIVRVAPRYPERAARRGIEGRVLIGFTITETGEVEDPVVLEAHPSGIFDRAALRAVRKFRFRPRLEDGVPVSQPDQRISIEFALEE